MLDPISDMLTRIRNAQRANRRQAMVPFSKVKSAIEKVPAIREIRRISTQGQRMYVKKDMIRKIRSGFGISIISTSQGIMTGAEARSEERRVGKEGRSRWAPYH